MVRLAQDGNSGDAYDAEWRRLERAGRYVWRGPIRLVQDGNSGVARMTQAGASGTGCKPVAGNSGLVCTGRCVWHGRQAGLVSMYGASDLARVARVPRLVVNAFSLFSKLGSWRMDSERRNANDTVSLFMHSPE